MCTSFGQKICSFSAQLQIILLKYHALSVLTRLYPLFPMSFSPSMKNSWVCGLFKIYRYFGNNDGFISSTWFQACCFILKSEVDHIKTIINSGLQIVSHNTNTFFGIVTDQF